MAQDQLRQRKNLFIVTATLVSRAAIQGGMQVEDAFSLSDSYIRQCERMASPDRIANLQYRMLLDYTERVERLHCPRPLHALLFLPDSPVSTGACYAKYDEAPDALRADSARLASALERGDFAGVAQNVYNALEKPACALNGDVREALEAARSFSPAACAVTGSGSAVFALFEAEELCRWAKSRYKGKIKTRVVTTASKRKAAVRNPFVLSEEEKLLK